MARKRDGLVPIEEAISHLGGPVKALREASPQAVHHFTQTDQVNQLVGASEADPDLGFMARLLALCSLPRTNPGNRLQYKRVNGPYKLGHDRGSRLQAPLRQSAAFVAGLGVRPKRCGPRAASSSWVVRWLEFMRTLGVYSDSGGRRANPAPKSDAAAVQRQRPVGLRG